MLGLFDFELDERYPLRRIPMIMRFNLDACGIRISLTAWIMLSREEREQLVATPCSSAAEQYAYRERLATLLAAHAGNPDAVVESVEIEAAPAWKNGALIPQAMMDSLAELALPVPSIAQWSALDELQRFSLIKLTRSGHKNANLQPAMREFGLV